MSGTSAGSTVLITGASTGIGNLVARALARNGYHVFAGMRDVAGKNKKHAEELTALAEAERLRITSLELDVQSQHSADTAVRTMMDQVGRIDVVVNNAGHLVVGYAEAFTAEDFEHLFDVNVFGVQRVNRAVLPVMRARGSGVLIYIGSTIPVSTPPFLAPYVASKAASDALAVTTAYEVSQFGIESVIVMPGAFTRGTQHFPNAGHASDDAVTHAYARLDALMARNEHATSSLFTTGEDADPQLVATEIVRILALPPGTKPARTVVDFTHAGVEAVNAALLRCQRNFVERMGFGELLSLGKPFSAGRL